MKKHTIAIIGAGRWGKNLIREYNTLATIAYIAHRQSSATNQYLLENCPEIPTTTNLNDIWNDAEVEAVVIATPIHTHFEIACAALKAGKHVFLEKPGTDSRKKFIELKKYADEHDLILGVGYIFAYHPAIQHLKTILSKEEIQDIKFTFTKNSLSEAHPALNLLCHELSILTHLDLTPITKESYEEKKREDGHITSLTLTGSARDIPYAIHIDQVNPDKERKIELRTKKGAVYTFLNNSLLINNVPEKINDISPLESEARHFLESLNTKKPPATNSDFAMHIWNVLSDILRN